jgi:phage FluMu protein gp41
LIPDLDILERRVAAMRDIPWPIPATIIIGLTDEDLDNLDAAANTDRYWRVLNGIISRIESEAQSA